jgi:hypothetical protein
MVVVNNATIIGVSGFVQATNPTGLPLVCGFCSVPHEECRY